MKGIMMGRAASPRERKHAICLAFLVSLLTAVCLTASPTAAVAAVSGSMHTRPGGGVSGVTRLCGPDPAYSCTSGGYSGQSTGWPGTLYGAGYASSNSYGYHNCTLYAAYRLASNGLGNPGWSANASGWATSAAAAGTTVDQTPAVGSIAQWNSGLGHVAYVEVVTGTYIEITDDNYGLNTTDRFRIATTSPAWPDNFIHLKDMPIYQPFAGDFNSDSQVDLGLRDTRTGMFYLRYGPTFAAQDTFQWDNSTSYQAFAGDFNADGHADVGLRNPASGMFYARFGPDFTAQTAVSWDNSLSTYQSFMGDFNSDGQVDIGLRNPVTGMFYVRYGPSFTGQDTPQWDNSTNYQAFVGDFNSDGHMDIGLRNPATGVFLTRYGPAFTTQTTFSWDNSLPSYQSLMGDYNDDGQVDVGLRNPVTGTFYVRYGPTYTTQTAYQWASG